MARGSHTRSLAVLGITLLLPAAAFAGTVTGKVTTAGGLGVADASVFVAEHELRTDAAGNYTAEDVPAGEALILVFEDGYRTESRTVTVPATGTVTADFALVTDLLYSDTVVVTGTRNPQTKRESSVAISTYDEAQIDAREPRSTADLLRAVPGFYVESSGGEVGGNLFARGLPADGSYRYVALMEDGMPVYDATELFFVNADIFVRVDENVAEMEAVRGGSAALYGSNAPGGVINFLSKTGGEVPRTDVALTAGTDGLWRVGFNTGGPVGDDWRYSVGGFYRFDEGVRDPGYPASKGGQIKMNLTRLFDQGYVRFYLKYLDDRNTFFLPVPFQAGGDLAFVPGFPFDGTLHTPEANNVLVPRPNDEGRLELPLEDGQRQEGLTLMAEISRDVGGGWTLSDTARYMEMDHSWNAVVPFDLVRVGDFAAGFVPPGGSFQYSFTDVAGPFSTQNDLLLTAGLWHVEKPMENFSNQLQLGKQFTAGEVTHNFAVGVYAGYYEAGNLWFFNDILTDVRTRPHLVDLTVFDAAGNPTRVTENGFRRYGSLFVNADGDVDLLAFFASDQIELGDWRFDLGARFETDTFRQFDEQTTNFDLGDPTTLADDAVGGGTGRVRSVEQSFDEWAFSLGANYLMNDRVAWWGRASSGFKMPILDNYLFGGGDLESEDLLQVEVGTRIGTPRWGLNASAYFLRLENFPSQDARVDPETGETVFATAFVGQAETIGLEVELVAEPWEGLRVDFAGTLQQPEYTDFVEGGQNFNGNSVRRIAEEIADLTVSYRWGDYSVSGNWHYIGDRFANNANTILLPEFDVATFRATWAMTEQTTLTAAVLNAFNSKGLTEGNPRLDEAGARAGAVFLARPVLPRRVELGVGLRF